MHNRIQSFLAAALVLSAAFAGAAALAASDPSAAEDHPTYGTATHITIAPGMRYTYTPAWPSDLTVTTTIEKQTSGSLTGSNVNIASMSSGTLIVNIPKNASPGTQYHVVLKATSTNPAQQTFIYIIFNTVANLSVSGTQGNVVKDAAFTFTPHATGMGTFTWAVKSGTSLPAGLSLDTATGKVSGKIADPGAYTISLTCTSSYGEVRDLVTSFRVLSKIAPTNSPANGAIVYVV